ncbi:MAG: glycosyltransferase family 2 protein [Candidatus Nomurabacteria bacterium]|nr:glycosyltransferase family 2 protein [Candidatus Nomurabacteria bacterium]
MLSIQIVTYNSEKIIQGCIESIFKLNLRDFEIIVIDNASTDKTIKVIEELKEKKSNIVLIKNSYNAGFAKAHNQASKIAKGDYIFILNPDTVFIKESTNGYLESLTKGENGAAYGFLFYNEDLTIQPTIGVFPNIFRIVFDRLPLLKTNLGIVIRDKKFYREKRRVDWVCGCGFLISRKNFLSIEGFNEEYFLYCEDIEICKRLNQKNIDIVFDPNVSFIHFKESRDEIKRPEKYFRMRQGLVLYFKKYRPKIEQTLLKIIIKIESVTKLLFHTKDKNWIENIRRVRKL